MKNKNPITLLFLASRRKPLPMSERCDTQQTNQPPLLRLFSSEKKCDEEVGGPRRSTVEIFSAVEHGSHNVSRWMTWLPISLKNAAKCDNWYELQNHSITESLNAKGAREKPSKGDPRACRIAQCRTKTTHPLPKAIWIGSPWVEMK